MLIVLSVLIRRSEESRTTIESTAVNVKHYLLLLDAGQRSWAEDNKETTETSDVVFSDYFQDDPFTRWSL